MNAQPDDIELPDGANEEDTERDGFLSYSGEWHALAIGAAVGFAAVAAGDYQTASALIAVLLGAARAGTRFTRKVTFNVKREPWYAIGGLALGGLVGLLAGGTLPL